MSGDKEVTSEQSPSICEGVGYDEIYLLRCELEKYVTQSLKREPSAHSPAKEEEEEYEEDEEGEEEGDGEEEEEVEGEEEEEEDDKEHLDEAVDQVDNSGTRPFILPLIWTENDFYPTMSLKVFNKLCDHFQIPENIPLHLLRKFERCYSGKTADVGMYNAMFAAGLRLLLTKLHCQLANYLGLSISQITPKAWRIFLGTKVICGQLSGGNCRLTLDKFFYYYKPEQILSSKGIYHFLARKTSLRLVSDMLDSNRNWKNKYFFVQGMD